MRIPLSKNRPFAAGQHFLCDKCIILHFYQDFTWNNRGWKHNDNNGLTGPVHQSKCDEMQWLNELLNRKLPHHFLVSSGHWSTEYIYIYRDRKKTVMCATVFPIWNCEKFTWFSYFFLFCVCLHFKTRLSTELTFWVLFSFIKLRENGVNLLIHNWIIYI